MNAAKVKSLSENGSSPLGREGWGEQSSLAFKETCNEMACYEQSCFWQGKNCVVLHYHCEILTKVCYRHFIKTLKNQLVENGHPMTPLKSLECLDWQSLKTCANDQASDKPVNCPERLSLCPCAIGQSLLSSPAISISSVWQSWFLDLFARALLAAYKWLFLQIPLTQVSTH